MQITILDTAIKSLIINKTIPNKRIYSPAELLFIKNSQLSTIKPIFFDDKITKKILKKKINRSETNSFHNSDTVNRNLNHTANRKIVENKGKCVVDRRQDVRQYSIEHPKVESTPQWFTEGPLNSDDQLEFEEVKIPSLQIAKAKQLEQNTMISYHNDKEVEQIIDNKKDDSVNIILRKPFNQKRNLLHDKIPRVYTLREIELELNVKQNNDDNEDVSGFYKLLKLIGVNSNKPNISTFEKKISNSEIDCKSLNLINTNSTVSNTCSKANDENASCLLENTIKHPEQQTCVNDSVKEQSNNLPESIFSHRNGGNNAFRWIRAMTNAASASAFICQNMYVPATPESENTFEYNTENSIVLQKPSLAIDASKIDLQNHSKNMNTLYYNECQDRQNLKNQVFAYQNLLHFPTNNALNNMPNRIYPQLGLQNSDKIHARPPFQPFILQKIIQQQQLAKLGYLADSTLNLLHLQNSQNPNTGYSPVPNIQNYSNSNCTSFVNSNEDELCSVVGSQTWNPTDYQFDENNCS